LLSLKRENGAKQSQFLKGFDPFKAAAAATYDGFVIQKQYVVASPASGYIGAI